ncbi:hypothetical protein C2G38_2032798 [Gigaspora rosea]|uniref:Uncharacterized protein n=1 Tax=Gigaspora rosea TaxID=44941 RepID=A0A397VLP5_9GLOM|nr:hypothetical protein C2G38_2032798 [Gigaspora rosea]
MPCHVDIIVRVSQVHQICNKDSKLITYHAVGVYPVGSEDCELDMALFIPIGVEERDANTQSIFETKRSFNDNSFKTVETKNSDSCKEKGNSVSDLNYKDFYSSKRVRIVDEKDDYFEYCDEGTSEHNKDSTVEGDKHKKNIACDSKSSKYSFEELSKGKEKVIQPVVHNTRKQSKSSKVVKSNKNE